jgi:hypothetical protein
MQPSWRRNVEAHPLATVFLLALAVRLLNVALLRGDAAFFAESDALGYWEFAAALADPEHGWTTLLTSTYRMPLYPLMLAGIRAVLGEAPRMVAMAQAVVDAGTCALIAALGALVRPRVGLVAGVLAAMSPTLIVISSQILTDTMFLLFFTTMLLAGAHFLRQPGPGSAAIAGLAGGLALITRPAIAILLLVSPAVAFGIGYARHRSMRAALGAAAALAIAAAAPVAPVVLRNVTLYDAWALTSQSADHLARWIVPLVRQRADGTPYRQTVDAVEELYRQRLAQHGVDAQASPFAAGAIRTQVAREAMAELPPTAFVKAWLEGMVVNLAAPALLADPRVRALPKPSFYATPGTSLAERARRHLLDDPGLYQLLLMAGLVATLPFLLLSSAGLVMLARTLPWAAVLAGGVVAYFLLLSGPVAAPKYRLPMEPVLIVLAAIPLARLVEPRRPPPQPASGSTG